MKIVKVWPLGYASPSGLAILTIADDANPDVAACAAFGSFAKVSSVRPAIPPTVEPVSEAYARMMSKNDNS